MKLFASNEEVAELEGDLTAAQGLPDLISLVSLAWHLRQRDCSRALTLADIAEQRLARAELPELECRRLAARLMLLRAEVKLLFADTSTAQQLADSASFIFAELGDRTGLGDAHWLNASIWVDRGSSGEVGACIERAIADYREAGDMLRDEAASARRLVNASFREPVATAAILQQKFPLGVERPASIATWIDAARANVAGLTDDPGTSIKHDLNAYDAARESGQIRHALVSVTNAAESFAMLGDLDASLEWSERALALARTTGWPGGVGFCLLQMGDVMRMLDRYDEARSCLQESLVLMAAQVGSRNYGQGLGNLGQLELDVGDYTSALDSFVRLEDHVKLRMEPDLLIRAWRGQASALLHLGRLREASLKAEETLTLACAQGNADGQIQGLLVMAEIHARGDLPAPDGMTAPTAALHYLRRAVDVAATITGYAMSPELLHQMAAAYAASGDYRAAYQSGLAADTARSKTRGLEAQKRALAMQIHHEVERSRADMEHHQRLAATLRDTAATLETLGIIGREITASLDADAVFAALYRHVHQLLDATGFAVFLINENHETADMSFGIEAGMPLPSRTVRLDSATSMVARCARERQEIVIERDRIVDSPNRIPGTLATLSLLYAPLMVSGRLLGVMTIQSPNAKAYGERERSIFLTLCAYGAIGLDNATAYGIASAAQRKADQALVELRQTQAQLVDDIAVRKKVERQLHDLNNDLESRIALRTQEMRATLAMLGENKQKLQGIVDTALDAVVRVDAGGVIVGWNVQAESIFGWRSDEAIGRSLHDTIIPVNHRDAHLRGMARYMATQESHVVDRRIEISALHRSGREFPIELAITRVTLEDRSKFEFCAFIRDIAQRKQAEDEIRNSLERQMELNQLKTRFVAMASHEFRTPLATIMSSSDLLKHYFDRMPESERNQLFQSITIAVKRMTKMLEDILLIGKSEAERAEFRPVAMSLAAFCQDIVDEIRSEQELAGTIRHDIRLSLSGKTDRGHFDEKLMRHIFGNLLSNAVKYSPRGGVVEFCVDCGADEFALAISDQGIGIPEEDLPRLFESFHRATNVGNISGTGLGLSIVKQSVELHSGTITVSSSLGKGTTFVVTLPRKKAT